MQKLGIIVTTYNSADYLNQCLAPWLEFKNGGGAVEFVFLDSLFKDFDKINDSESSTDGTLDILKQYENLGIALKISSGLPESEVRTLGLTYLLNRSDFDIIGSIGADEVFCLGEIKNLYKWFDNNNLVAYYKLHYKNLVFTDTQYVDGFCPSRFWRTNYNGLKMKRWYYDDDVVYLDALGNEVRDAQLSHTVIPKKVCYPRHYTWINNERSRQKIAYQQKRWGKDGCSYDVDKEGNLCFSPSYYQKHNLAFPEIKSCG